MTVFFNLKYNNSNILTNDYIYIDIDKFLEICESYRILPDYCYNKIKNYELNIIIEDNYSFYNNILSSIKEYNLKKYYLTLKLLALLILNIKFLENFNNNYKTQDVNIDILLKKKKTKNNHKKVNVNNVTVVIPCTRVENENKYYLF